MAKKRLTDYIPNNMPAVIPQLVVSDTRAFIDFAKQVFGASGANIMTGPDDKTIIHAMFMIAGAPVFVADASPMAPATRANIFVYVPDVDLAVARAVERGANVVAPAADMFWGDRWALVADPFGNTWQVASHQEDVRPEDMHERMMAMMAG